MCLRVGADGRRGLLGCDPLHLRVLLFILITDGILSFKIPRPPRTCGVQDARPSYQNRTRFTGSKALIPSVYKRQYACQRLKSALAASSSSVGASPPSSSSLPAPVLSCRQVRRSFSGADLVAGKADEAAGLPPGNEDNAASCLRCPEKPYCPLSTEGMFWSRNLKQRT